MYKYVTNATVKPFRIFCDDKMNQVKQFLEAEYDLASKFYLVGSGARNLVTQNDNEPFDLDYNIELLNVNIHNPNIGLEIKNAIMNFLNEILIDSHFSNCQDSTAVITSRSIINRKRIFSFDIAILAKNSIGDYCRLIHDKLSLSERFYWVQIPNSKEISKKIEIIKSRKQWNELRDTYLKKKNMYLKIGDRFHSSYIIFNEAVNEVYMKSNIRQRDMDYYNIHTLF